MRSDPSGRDGDVGYMAPGDFSDLDFSPLFRPVAKQVARGVIVKYSPLAKRLLDHYMDESGTTYTLTEQDMSDVRVRIDLRNSPQFEPLIASLNGENDFEPVEDTEILLFSGSAGTLGRLMGVLNGEIRGTSESDWSFSGTIRFKNTYHLAPQPCPQRAGTEIRVDVFVEILCWCGDQSLFQDCLARPAGGVNFVDRVRRRIEAIDELGADADLHGRPVG